MAAAPQIPLPAPLRVSNLASDWKRFKGQWTNYVKAAKLDREASDCQAAIFLACIGSDAYEILTTMAFAEEEHKEDPVRLLEAFEQHCVGEVNEVYERYVLHRRQQEPGETFDSFLGDLRRLIKTCEYGAAEESTIRDRIVLGIRDDATRKKLLQTRKLTLTQAVDICRSSEATMRQLKTMTAPEDVQAMTHQHLQLLTRGSREILTTTICNTCAKPIRINCQIHSVSIAANCINPQGMRVQPLENLVLSVAGPTTMASCADPDEQRPM